MPRRSITPSTGAWRRLVGALACAAIVGSSAAAAAKPSTPATTLPSLRLDDPSAPRLSLLSAFHHAAVEKPGAIRRYLGGPWGRWGVTPWQTLEWGLGTSPFEVWQGVTELHPLEASGLDDERTPEPLAPRDATDLKSLLSSWLATPKDPLAAGTPPTNAGLIGLLGRAVDVMLAPAKNRWCRRRPVTFVRYAGETDRFALVGCDGSVAPHALDRLSLMARPPEVPRPGELLPDEPDPGTWTARGEWVDGVRPVHPRLVWLLQRIADGFPNRTIYVYSGYRPRGSKGHSYHHEARAMDIQVMGVPNADLFRYCRTLDDVGCGYYPNSKFVHVDVRRPGTGRAFWVDASGPGEPAQYVDSWPGVVESGALVWERKDPY